MKRLLISYSYFAPAFKAGGPVQSLVSLVEVLRHQYRIYVVCSAYDLGEHQSLRGIEIDRWNAYGESTSVFYSTGSGYQSVRQALKEVNPDIVYINGVFLPAYNWYPLWLAKCQKRRVVIAPRGMLQQGALAIRSSKKKWFLRLFKLLQLHCGVVWHATDEQEQKDIQGIIGEGAVVKLAPNIPKTPVVEVPLRYKNKGELRLVYLSLIAEKKNLHLVLEALKVVRTPIQFDIYGPVKDEIYWLRCQDLMNEQIHAIHYLGPINPLEVQPLLAQYHALVLPTRGENFGHAIYEALSVGTPAIISSFTPWGVLQDKEAGITHELNVQSLADAIRNFVELDNHEFTKLSLGANKVATEYFQQHDYLARYRELFHS